VYRERARKHGHTNTHALTPPKYGTITSNFLLPDITYCKLLGLRHRCKPYKTFHHRSSTKSSSSGWSCSTNGNARWHCNARNRVTPADGTHTTRTLFIRCEGASRRSLTPTYSASWSFCLIRTQKCLNGGSKFRLTDHTVPHHRTQYRCDSVMGEVNYTSTPSSLYHWTDVSGQLHNPAGSLPGKWDTKNLNSLSLSVCCFVRILTFLRLHYGSLLNNNKKNPY
jgi:hypothetical protein